MVVGKQVECRVACNDAGLVSAVSMGGRLALGGQDSRDMGQDEHGTPVRGA
jgi:hypothetical protein